ncbi:MAG: pseudouridine synthase [Gammaproteobacteria bacterium]|nr:pseudouridine synthase [Gammaproteobacteria bacterium]
MNKNLDQPGNYVILFNKPYGVLCQFTGPKPNLAEYIPVKGFYPAGRLDKDSEGLVVLTDNGQLQAQITDPEYKMKKTYWAQVEGKINATALNFIKTGVLIKGKKTAPAQVKKIHIPLSPREPDIRRRENIPTSWLEIVIKEGRNRQIRKMTAAAGFPTLRLYRTGVGPWNIFSTPTGSFQKCRVNYPLYPRLPKKLRRSPD